MKRFWCTFFVFWPIMAVILCWVAPAQNWWFPRGASGTGAAMSPLGERIDDLFYMILIITAVTFVGTQIGLGYVLFTGARRSDAPHGAEDAEKTWFTHGSHNLEVMWSVVPAAVLLFIALYQMEVWAEFRVKDSFPDEVRTGPIAEVTARQFEWRIRYPGLDANGNPLELMPDPQPTDLYTVNELHVTSAEPVMIWLRSEDVQHSFFLPELRVKQDAVPGLVIPVWFEATKSTDYSWLCAELCGWGHYKMKGRFVAEPEEDLREWMQELQNEQMDDGVPDDVGDSQVAD